MRSGPQIRFIATCDAIMRSMVVLRLWGQLEIAPSGVFSQSNARTRAPISPPLAGQADGPGWRSLPTEPLACAGEQAAVALKYDRLAQAISIKKHLPAGGLAWCP